MRDLGAFINFYEISALKFLRDFCSFNVNFVSKLYDLICNEA